MELPVFDLHLLSEGGIQMFSIACGFTFKIKTEPPTIKKARRITCHQKIILSQVLGFSSPVFVLVLLEWVSGIRHHLFTELFSAWRQGEELFAAEALNNFSAGNRSYRWPCVWLQDFRRNG
jgi:hypothetical protein